MQQKQDNLLQLIYAKENQQLQQIKKRLSQYCKYFVNWKLCITIIYDANKLYIIHKDYLKIIELGKSYIITDLAYNSEKNVVLFLTIQGALFAYFATAKFIVPIKKDFKRVFTMDWIYGSPQTAHFFISEEGGIHLYRFQQQKKCFKEVKNLSGKYHCVLHDPFANILVAFTYGDCQTANIIHFDPSKAKNWFRSGQVQINFQKDEVIAERIKRFKHFGLESSRVSKEIFAKHIVNQDYFIDCLRISNCTYICFYMGNQGKLKLTPIDQKNQRKSIIIKLPSDSIPTFNIVDNMLAVHLKNEKITFIYDIGPVNFQTLVSPYPLTHQDPNITTSMIYNGSFIGKRVLMNDGHLCKWKINLRVIFHFLRNQMLVFEFLNNRSNSKMQIIRWLRDNLFNINPLNLSRIWKYIFLKCSKGLHDQSDIVTIIELYSNLFYTLSIDPLVSKEALTNILIQCLRQTYQFHVKIPNQLQLLMTELLIQSKKYQILAYLCHHCIIKPDAKIHRLIFDQGLKTNQELLVTLSIDMASQGTSAKEILRLLLKTGRLRQGKRYLRGNSDKFEVLDMVEAGKYVQKIAERKEYINFIKMFITHKFPSINTLYLQEAEKKLFQ